MNGNNEVHTGGYLGMLALGAVIGAAVAMLYAPRSGADTRDFLARRARELKDKAEETLSDAKARLMGKAEELKARV